MELRVMGLLNGAGSAMYIGLGGEPKAVELRNVTSADLDRIDWNINMSRMTVCPEGILTRPATTLVQTALTYGAGVRVYAGGDVIATASDNYVLSANQIADLKGDMRLKGTLGIVNGWTLDTSGSQTGHFNVGVNTTYVGVGSRVNIAGEVYSIQAITNDGDAADEITLERDAPTGVVEQITYKWDFGVAPVGQVMPAGIIISEATYVNVNNELVALMAWW